MFIDLIIYSYLICFFMFIFNLCLYNILFRYCVMVLFINFLGDSYFLIILELERILREVCGRVDIRFGLKFCNF